MVDLLTSQFSARFKLDAYLQFYFLKWQRIVASARTQIDIINFTTVLCALMSPRMHNVRQTTWSFLRKRFAPSSAVRRPLADVDRCVFVWREEYGEPMLSMVLDALMAALIRQTDSHCSRQTTSLFNALLCVFVCVCARIMREISGVCARACVYVCLRVATARATYGPTYATRYTHTGLNDTAHSHTHTHSVRKHARNASR